MTSVLKCGNCGKKNYGTATDDLYLCRDCKAEGATILRGLVRVKQREKPPTFGDGTVCEVCALLGTYSFAEFYDAKRDLAVCGKCFADPKRFPNADGFEPINPAARTLDDILGPLVVADLEALIEWIDEQQPATDDDAKSIARQRSFVQRAIDRIENE